MAEELRLSPYRSDRQYARLETYRRLGVPDVTWAAEQFQLRVEVSTLGAQGGQERAATIWEAFDRLPLQVKDIVRNVIDEVRIDPGQSFAEGTMGSWRRGVIRINRDWSQMPILRDGNWHRRHGYDLLRAALVHECGHALIEDPRGGVPLRDFVSLVAASGWLPHPLRDPVPYGPVGRDLAALTSHYLERLARVDARWDPDLPLGSPGMPPALQLDRDMMAEVSPATQQHTSARGTLGLLGPDRLLERLRMERPDELELRLRTRGMSLEQVDSGLRQRHAVTLYAQETVSETPAEIFRYLHVPYTRSERSQQAVREGRRTLLDPWRLADRIIGRRREALPPERPWEALQLVRTGVGRELGR